MVAAVSCVRRARSLARRESSFVREPAQGTQRDRPIIESLRTAAGNAFPLHVAHSARLAYFARVVAFVALALFVGASTAEQGSGRPALPVLALVVVAGSIVLFGLTPKALFLGWLAAAPIIGESAASSSPGHPLWLGLYLYPSLVLLVWALTRRSTEVRPRFLDVLPLGYFLYVIGSLAVTGHPSVTVVKSAYVVFGIAVVVYYFLAFGPSRSISWTNFSTVVLLVAALESGMAIVDGLTHWNLWHDTNWQGPGARAVATLSNPTVLGTFVGMGIVLATSILVWNGPLQLRRIGLVTLLLGFPALYFTLSRGPVIATAAGLVFVLMSRAKTRVLAFAIAVLMVVGITASWGKITSSTLYHERITNAQNVDVRVKLQSWSLKLAEKKPLFGWGFNDFNNAKAALGFTAQDVQTFGVSTTSHNTYLTVLVDYGSIGLFLFAVPWLVILWGAVKAARRHPDARWFLVGCLSLSIVYVIGSSTADFKYFSVVPMMAMASLALLRRHQLAPIGD
jgi:O-antigen ligase